MKKILLLIIFLDTLNMHLLGSKKHYYRKSLESNNDKKVNKF